MAGRFLVVFRHSLEACQALLVQVLASSGQVPAVQGHVVLDLNFWLSMIRPLCSVDFLVSTALAQWQSSCLTAALAAFRACFECNQQQEDAERAQDTDPHFEARLC